jgi:hypothetical protein
LRLAGGGSCQARRQNRFRLVNDGSYAAVFDDANTDVVALATNGSLESSSDAVHAVSVFVLALVSHSCPFRWPIDLVGKDRDYPRTILIAHKVSSYLNRQLARPASPLEPVG